jgi:hypothetical protein
MKQNNIKTILTICTAILMMTACSNNNPRVPADLQQKLDSIRALEQLERLRAQGINLDENASPMQQFYDSLAIQPLPLVYSADYVSELPNYQTVPQSLAQLMNFGGRLSTKAIALPETTSLRLMIVAADAGDNQYTLWLYSLSSDFFPADKLCIYTPTKFIRKTGETQRREFSITSEYEIFLTKFTYGLDYKTERQWLFTIDELLHFKEWKEE